MHYMLSRLSKSNRFRLRHCIPGLRLAAFLVCIYGLTPAASAQEILPNGFAEKQYATNLSGPTAMAFALDPCPSSGTPVHRLFVCEQAGRVRVFRNGVLQAKPFLTVSADTRGERGLDGICFDPNFATNGYVYIYYTVLQADSTLPTHNRLSRFTADPANPDVALAGSETRIMEMDNLSATSYIHNGGALHFGPDGKLYVSLGENGTASNSQSLNTVLGKILRINPVPENPDGTNPEATFPSDNPFYNSITGKNRAIYIRGLRNPFTFNFQPGTGRMFIDDVGAATWEEINNGIKGGNYGWPTYEGPVDPPVPGFINPLFAYVHNSNQGPPPYGCAITGGAFYNPPPLCPGDPPFGFPSSYIGQYFFMDYCNQWIYMMDPNQIDPTSPHGFHKIQIFASNIPHSFNIYLTVGPDRNLYYLSRDTGSVYQIRYPASLAPTIGTQPADQLVGQGWPATFTVAASGVPTLHYRWQRNDVDISGAADSPSYTLQNPQVATDNGAKFRCIVSNPYGSTTTREALLSVTTKQPPIPTITSPPPNTYYRAGDVISFAGSAVDGHDIVTGDPQDGTLSPSALTWEILFEHHALTDPNHHTHPFFLPTSGITGGTVTLNFGETDPDVWYRIFLTAKDSYGLSQTTFRDIKPAHVQLSLATNPTGLKVKLDGSAKPTPYNFWSVIRMTRNIGVDTPQILNGVTYDFVSWSDNGARFHNISAPETATTYVATFARRLGYGSITANPNPVQLASGATTGVTTIFWTSGQTTKVEVHRDSPSGLLVAQSGPGSFSQQTGNWVQEGTTLFLQDVSNGQPLTSTFTLASVTLHATTAFAASGTPTGSMTANPNPFVPDSTGLGKTTIAWTSYGTSQVEIHVDAPNGNKMTSSGPGSFSATTGQWVQNGQTFYLQNVSNGLPLTSANTLATVTLKVLITTPTGSMSASPNPFVPNSQGLGQTTLTWTSAGTSRVEIHVDAPNGNMMTSSGPGTFSATTGQWVQNGQKFYLQNVSNGLPLTSANTLATVTMIASP
jgi:glucose/arabinose dehydrogenase